MMNFQGFARFRPELRWERAVDLVHIGRPNPSPTGPSESCMSLYMPLLTRQIRPHIIFASHCTASRVFGFLERFFWNLLGALIDRYHRDAIAWKSVLLLVGGEPFLELSGTGDEIPEPGFRFFGFLRCWWQPWVVLVDDVGCRSMYAQIRSNHERHCHKSYARARRGERRLTLLFHPEVLSLSRLSSCRFPQSQFLRASSFNTPFPYTPCPPPTSLQHPPFQKEAGQLNQDIIQNYLGNGSESQGLKELLVHRLTNHARPRNSHPSIPIHS